MAGTDGKGDVPGQALQQEFAGPAKAGLPPLRILQMATIEPARFLGRTQSMGGIAPARRAAKRSGGKLRAVTHRKIPRRLTPLCVKSTLPF